jgi:hypothetical protein
MLLQLVFATACGRTVLGVEATPYI